MWDKECFAQSGGRAVPGGISHHCRHGGMRRLAPLLQIAFFRLNVALQFTITVSGGEDRPETLGVVSRKRLPSAVTSYCTRE